MTRIARAGRGLIGLLILLLLGCTGCGASSEILAGGETITPEQLRDISEALFSDPEEPESTSDTEPNIPLAAWDGEVYWLSGGTVAHTDRDCYHIRGKDGVQSGSAQDAANAGKTSLCSVCRKAAQQTVATAEPETPDTEPVPQTDPEPDSQTDLPTATDVTETAEPLTDIDPATEPPVIMDDSLAAWDGEVYWLSGGTVAHTDRDCYHIRGKDGVQSGSAQDAANAGKTSLCKVCRKRTEQTEETGQAEPETNAPAEPKGDAS